MFYITESKYVFRSKTQIISHLSKHLCNNGVTLWSQFFLEILVRNKRVNIRTNMNIYLCINIPIYRLISHKYLRFRQFWPWGGIRNHVSLLKRSILVARFFIFLTFPKFALFGRIPNLPANMASLLLLVLLCSTRRFKVFLELINTKLFIFLSGTRLALSCISEFEKCCGGLCLLWYFFSIWIDTIKSFSVIASLLCLRVFWKLLQEGGCLSIRSRTYILLSIGILFAMILVTRFWIWWFVQAQIFHPPFWNRITLLWCTSLLLHSPFHNFFQMYLIILSN